MTTEALRRRARACGWTVGLLAAFALSRGLEPGFAQDGARAAGEDGTVTDALGLQADDYWGPTPEPTNDAIRALRDEDFDGLVLGGPTRVALDARETVPVIVYRGGSFRQLAQVDFGKLGLVTVMDVDHNELRVGPVVDEPDVVRRGGARDLDSLPDGYSGVAKVIDLGVRCRVPRRPGRHIATALMREKVSNRLTIQLVSGETSFDDPEVAKLLRAERLKTPAATVFPAPGDPLPAYGEVKGTPEVPAQVGLELALDRAVVLRPGAQAVLRGAFRLPVLPEEVVKAGGTPLGADHEGEQPTAVRRVTLLVTGGDDPVPTTFALELPSWDPVDPAAEAPVVTGRFAIDLLRLRGMQKKDQTYFVYAFSGEVMVGPLLMALVAEESLPQRR